MSKQVYHVCNHCKQRTATCHIYCKLYANEVREAYQSRQKEALKTTYARPERFARQDGRSAKIFKNKSHKK